MALNLTYNELRRLRRSTEKQVSNMETRITRIKKFLEGENVFGSRASKPNEGTKDRMADLQEEQDILTMIITKISEEMRRLEGIDKNRSNIRGV